MLPEIVEHGREGLHVDVTSESIAAAILRLARDRALREALGSAAAARAACRLTLAAQAEATERVYARCAAASAAGGAIAGRR
jgi:glycosyltransferase involved in cell wall biosynthesis